jgi:uncharacterized membrane protein (DUF2068 family)
VADQVLNPPRASWWSRFRTDLGRRIEHRGPVVWFLIIERGLRGLAVFGLGLYLVTLNQDRLAAEVESIQLQFGLTEGSGGLIRHAATYVLNQVAHLSARGVVLIAVGSLVYGSLELLEAAGLLLRRRWAEYLVVVATGLGIPLEIREVIAHATLLRGALLVVNVAVVVYLVMSKRLFIFDEGANA